MQTLENNAVIKLGTCQFCGSKLRIESIGRRIRIEFGGETIADSKRAILFREEERPPAVYIPLSDVRTDLFESTDLHTICRLKGEASYWTIKVGDREAKNAVWSYLDPTPDGELIRGYVSFYWDKVDRWYQEEEEIVDKLLGSYEKLNALSSSRHVQIVVDGEIVAESRRPVVLFEQGVPPRYYIPKEDIRFDLLEPSELKTNCSLKGVASYWNVNIGDRTHENIVWSYVEPIAGVSKIAGHYSFYPDKIDAIYVDSERLTTV